jgi:4'-phosphopantetheinyl transferase EntD
VDVEPDLPLEETLWDSVLTPDELAWLSARPAGERGRLARLIFSAKECAYKLQYPLTRTLYGFMDMRVEMDVPAGPIGPCFCATSALSGGAPAWRETFAARSERWSRR